MSTDTLSFLETLLWLADDPDRDKHPLAGKTVRDFHPDFISAVDKFCTGFRRFLEMRSFDTERLDALKRSVGGSLYLSLSGHGAGFFDEYPPNDKELGHDLHALAGEFSGNRWRFEELEHQLSTARGGKIDLAFYVRYLPEQRARIFSHPIRCVRGAEP